MDKQSISELLEKIKDINKEYQEKYQKNLKESSFNIFQIERIDRKEVNMCRFLGAILDPNAGHEMGNKFLISFVKDVLKYNDFEEKISQNVECSVVCEELIDESRRIDLVIKGSGVYIPIEAKIGAGDEYRQCTDYLTYAKNKIVNAKLYYLTIDGRAPSEKSVEGLNREQKANDIIKISWQNISEWVEKWRKNLLADGKCDLAFCFKQYRYAINNFISNTEFEEKMIKEFCKNVETLKAANEVYLNYNKARISIMKEFFAELKERIYEAAMDIDDQDLLVKEDFVMNKSLDEDIQNYYKNKTYPSITFPFKKDKISGMLKDFIGNDYEFAIRIEVKENLFIGLCVPYVEKELSEEGQETKIYENKGMPINCESIRSYIQKDIDSGKTTLTYETKKDKYIKDWWVAWQYIKFNNSKKTVNFKDADIKNNEDYFSLCDKKKISELVSNCCEDFKKVYNYCKTLLNI